MGHSEMGLAVAGLNRTQIREVTKRLAGGDWSAFPPGEQAAFRLAYQLTRNPKAFSDEDARNSIATFGVDRTVDLIWYTGWGNYMTRVADAFQLPLERTNVF